jgi:hypothetical protein
MNSEVRYHRRRLADTAAALRMARTQVRREQGPRAQLASHQQQRLETVARHAASHSPFYRRWFAETGALGEEPVQLQRLPVLDKVLLMEHFDELVCDPRLHRDQLPDWAGQLTLGPAVPGPLPGPADQRILRPPRPVRLRPRRLAIDHRPTTAHLDLAGSAA